MGEETTPSAVGTRNATIVGRYEYTTSMNKNLPSSKVFNIGKGQKARLWLWVQRNLNFSWAGNFAYCSWSKAEHVLCLPNICTCDASIGQIPITLRFYFRSYVSRFSCHAVFNDIFCEFTVAACVLAISEPNGIVSEDGKRQDGMTLIPWRIDQT